MARRLVFKNPEILTPYRKEGRSIMLLLSHHGNWEWPVLIPKFSGYKTLAVYKPLENKYFDRFFIRLRSLGGAVCVPVESTIREVIMHRKKEIPILVYTLADQRPRWRDLRHWTRFLEQDTPVIAGPEKTARKFNMVTVMLSLNKIKRGYYEAEFRVLNENPSDADQYSIMRRYYGILEKLIRSRPELYLWTHKRWKYRRQEAPNPPVEIGLPLSEEYGH
jgi:KDO2-lipid IV(A) lauroyltransferase